MMDKDWETVLKNPDNDYIFPLFRKYFQIYTQPNDYDYREKFKKNLSQLIPMVDRDLVVKGIYEGIKLEKGYEPARQLIKEHSLFDAKNLLRLVNEGFVKQTITLLAVEQPSYSEADLRDIEALLEALDNLPDVGRIETVKDGLFQKEVEKFICAHGHRTNADAEYCSSCGENIKGINRYEKQAIEELRNKVTVLRDLLERGKNNGYFQLPNA